MPPRMSGLCNCDVGQQSLYQPPVSMTSRLPSASSRMSVGWKSRLSETRKSSSRALKVAPCDVSTCREILCMLNWQANRLSWYGGPKAVDSYRTKPHRSEERRVGKEGRSRWWACHEIKKSRQ